MPVESLIVINMAGNILHSSYFSSTADAARKYEQSLFKETSKIWNKQIMLGKQTIAFADVSVVFQRLGELIIFVSGSDEADEIILAELHETILKVLNELLNGVITEKELLNVENYGKFLVCLDEILSRGVIENMDAESVLKLSKLRF